MNTEKTHETFIKQLLRISRDNKNIWKQIEISDSSTALRLFECTIFSFNIRLGEYEHGLSLDVGLSVYKTEKYQYLLNNIIDLLDDVHIYEYRVEAYLREVNSYINEIKTLYIRTGDEILHI